MKKAWYEELFADYANNYEKEMFTQGTQGEVDFLEKEMDKNTSLKILDIGCGTGRHAIELAKRGYTLTGIDLSQNMLNRALEKAKQAGLTNVTFKQMDARKLQFSAPFDLIYCLCEGALCLMASDEEDNTILRSMVTSLKPGGTLIFTVLNAFHAVTHPKEHPNFDLHSSRGSFTMELTADSGITKIIQSNERFYTPFEIQTRLKEMGMRTVECFGAQLGHFSRNLPVNSEDYEFLTIAIK